MSAEPIRVEEWLAELEKLSAAQADGFTTNEFLEASGKSRRWALDSIGRGIKAGVLEYAGKRTVSRIDGSPTKVPVYRVVHKGGKRGKG